jgi:hypothetical protein
MIGAVALLLLLLLFQAVVNILDSFDVIEIGDQPSITDEEVSPSDTLRRAEAAANAAESTANELQTLLSFLEGAAVLVGLALGATAYVGFRDLEDARNKLKMQIEPQLETLKALQADLEQYKVLLEEFPDQVQANEQLQQNYSDLLIASQELRLNNHLEAYAAAMRVLERDKNNAPALYTAGWLELQYIFDKRQDGIEKLKRVKEVQPDWPTAQAAYGVGLRRQARSTKNETEKRQLFLQAEGELLGALGKSPHLLDLNQESFWGPVGGIRRELENVSGAIEAYREALKVTPTSSYPQGNLSALLLKQAQNDISKREEALDAFKKTFDFASVELAVNPGDYFHVMDVAMSRMMLGQRGSGNFAAAFDTLDSALSMHVTPEILNTSLQAGWQFLYDNCPDEWGDVKENLETAIEQVKKMIEEKQA